MEVKRGFELKFMRAIFEASGDGILVVNHQNSAIIARNDKFLKIFCIPEHLKNTADDQALLREVISNIKDPDQFLSLVADLYKHPDRSSHDFIALNDGRTVERHSEAVKLGEEILGRVWYFTDITQARKNEAEYQATQAKMIASSRLAEIGEMAGGIAHEINNPLAVIQGKVEQLVSRSANGTLTAERLQADLGRITRMSERIAKIIRSLRTFSRNAEKDEMTEVPLQTIVEETLELCQERLKKNNIQFDFDGTRDIMITCRASQIGQVLLNLISNAIDAIEQLPTKWIKIESHGRNNRIEITVTDSGSGISPGILDKIMQPFFTTKELGRGTGLGLSVSLGIIQDHGGTLSYHATSNNTCFLIDLPRSVPATLRNAS